MNVRSSVIPFSPRTFRMWLIPLTLITMMMIALLAISYPALLFVLVALSPIMAALATLIIKAEGPTDMFHDELVIITNNSGDYRRSTTEAGVWLNPFTEKAIKYWPKDVCTIPVSLEGGLDANLKVAFEINLSDIDFLRSFQDGAILSKHISSAFEENVPGYDTLKLEELKAKKCWFESVIHYDLENILKGKKLADHVTINNVTLEYGGIDFTAH